VHRQPRELVVSSFTRRIGKWTAIVIAIGGFLAAYSDVWKVVHDAWHYERAVEAVSPPVIPPQKTDWVTGVPDPYKAFCEPLVKAYQVQYPQFTISATMPEGEHESYYNPFKQDRYRYTCVPSATQRTG
jgi:hypothetical protein